MKLKNPSLTVKDAKENIAQLDNKKAERLYLSLRAALHPLRQRIMGEISHYGERTVQPIYNALKIEQSICSQHLKILRAANIVTCRRAGKHIYYSVNVKTIRELKVAGEALSIAL